MTFFNNRVTVAGFAIAFVALVALTGCGRQDAAPTLPAKAPAPTVATAPPASPVAPNRVVVKPVNVSITGVHLGRGFAKYNLIAQETAVFSSKDQVDVSVYSDGSAKTATIRVVWITADGRPMGEQTREVIYNGSQATPFSLARAEGLAPGSYAVEVFLNDWKAVSTPFEVR